MLFSLKRQSLHSALQHISAGLCGRPVIPVLAGIKLQADSRGLTLASCNTIMTLQYCIRPDNVMIGNQGEAVIPARYLMDIVRNLQDETVTVEEIAHRLICIRAGRAVYRLSAMDGANFPDMEPIDRGIGLRIGSDILKRMVNQVSFAVASSEARMILTGVRLQTDGSSLTVTATDGIRFASRTSGIEGGVASDRLPGAVIPARNVHDYCKMLADEPETTNIIFGERLVRFAANHFTMQTSLIEGLYPSVDKLNPELHATEIILDSSGILSSVERVLLLSRDTGIVGLHLSQEGGELHARTAEIGDVTESVEFEGRLPEPIVFSFNGKYMRDILRAVGCGRVRLKFAGKDKPVVIQPTDDARALYILMPVRTL